MNNLVTCNEIKKERNQMISFFLWMLNVKEEREKEYNVIFFPSFFLYLCFSSNFDLINK